MEIAQRLFNWVSDDFGQLGSDTIRILYSLLVSKGLRTKNQRYEIMADDLWWTVKYSPADDSRYDEGIDLSEEQSRWGPGKFCAG